MSNYDPRQAYNERKTPAAKAADRRRSGSSDKYIGGHPSNYRDK